MNWSTAIPLVSAFGAVFAAGMAWGRLIAIDKRLADLRNDLKDSAKEQGVRIGAVEEDAKVLKHWHARVEGAEDRERELSGVVRRQT